MSASNTISATTAPDSQAAAIADAELRLAMLRRLASLGMRLAEEVCERAINAPYHPEPRHEPGRAFATVSRSVRLTLVLQAKVEAGLLALRNGKPPAADAGLDIRPVRSSETTMAALDGATPNDDFGDGLDDDGSPEALDRARESLSEYEGERFDEVVSGKSETRVAAVRADLGISHDWSHEADNANSSLPFMGRAKTKRGEVRGGDVSLAQELLLSSQAPPPRSAPPSRPSP